MHCACFILWDPRIAQGTIALKDVIRIQGIETGHHAAKPKYMRLKGSEEDNLRLPSSVRVHGDDLEVVNRRTVAILKRGMLRALSATFRYRSKYK